MNRLLDSESLSRATLNLPYPVPSLASITPFPFSSSFQLVSSVGSGAKIVKLEFQGCGVDQRTCGVVPLLWREEVIAFLMHEGHQRSGR